MSLEMWSQLDKYENETNLDADTLNVPIQQLGDRTAYLYAKLKEMMAGGPMSAVVLTDVALSTDKGEEPYVGNAVRLDQTRQLFTAAKATMSLYDDFMAAESAFTIGILMSKDGNRGNVIAYGSMNLNPSGAEIPKDSMIETGEEFRPGRYFLSAKEAGKLTAYPSGPVIYVCTIGGSVSASGGLDGSAIVSPQFLDIGTSHIHRVAALTARPAGTRSTAGYLPIDQSGIDDNSSSPAGASSGPLALRFGGTWTNDAKVSYDFRMSQGTAEWPGGVILQWTEDGGREVHSVTIPGPDVEVPISHGLTARLSIGTSGPTVAYSGLSQDQIRWPTLVFPDAGMGWLDHMAYAVAEAVSVPGLKVAISGRLESSVANVSARFPGRVDAYDLAQISAGDRFTYDGAVYVFTDDMEANPGDSSYDEDDILVPLGPCLADSALYLAKAMADHYSGSSSSSEGGASFAVFESDGGSHAKFVVMDGSGLLLKNAVQLDGDTTLVKDGFDVKGATGVKMVLADGEHRILSDTVMIEGVSSYVWKDAGNMSVMVFQDTIDTVTVPLGTVASALITDDEPDALYDYVIGMDPKISNYWPPVPPKSAALMVNGVEMDNKALLPGNPTVSFGKDTIHWFEDETGRKPWPEAFESRDAAISPELDKAEVMHWVRGFQGATGPVTSIQPKSGSPLKVYGYGTFDPANTGDLELDVAFDFRIVNGGAPGFYVPKRSRSGALIAGPVVERLVAGPGVSIVSGAGCPAGQGTVMVSLGEGSYMGQFTDIALENAEQAKIGMFPYIRLKGYSGSSITHPSAFTATMRVPTSLPDGKYALGISASVFGEEGFSDVLHDACVRLSYSILPDFKASSGYRYRNLKTTLLKPDGDRNILIPFGHSQDGGILYNGFDPILVTTEDSALNDEQDVVAKRFGTMIPDPSEFGGQEGVIPELRPGYLVGIRISRAVPGVGSEEPYRGAIGFLNLSWTIASAG